jgi:hypothetical protein
MKMNRKTGQPEFKLSVIYGCLVWERPCIGRVNFVAGVDDTVVDLCVCMQCDQNLIPELYSCVIIISPQS